MNRTVRAVVLTLALTVGGVFVAAPTASAEIVPTYVPRVDSQVSFGWVTATIYFNRSETLRIASLTWPAATMCAAVAAFGGGIAGLACALGAPRIVWGAILAKDRGVCVGLRFVIVSPSNSWTVTHSGGRCF